MLDSFFGAVFQALNTSADGLLTERLTVSPPVKGFQWIINDVVNGLITVLSARFFLLLH